tara:strand:- start:174 stop:275 length:102 start_codon:yes stop_codon:yes gene_type:complete
MIQMIRNFKVNLTKGGIMVWIAAAVVVLWYMNK